MNRKLVAIVFSISLGGLTLAQSRPPSKNNIGEMKSALSVSSRVQPSHECGLIEAKDGVLGESSFFGLALAAQDTCSDSIDNCNDPVQYLGSNGECACFACEYGRATQHNICTKNESDKKKLLKRAGAQ